MDTLTRSRLLSTGTEDALFLTIAVGTLLLYPGLKRVFPSKHEQARLRDFFGVPQQSSRSAVTAAAFQPASRNICEVLEVISPRTQCLNFY